MIEQTSDPKRICYWVSDYQGCGWYRARVPGFELRRRGHIVEFVRNFKSEAVRDWDVIVFQRKYLPAEVEILDQARSAKITTVFELDDDLWHLRSDNPAARVWHRPGVMEAVADFIGKVDVVTTTTPQLVNILSQYHDNVVVLPNMLPAEFWPPQRKPTKKGQGLVIGWAGSACRDHDLRPIEGALLTILDRYPSVRGRLAGLAESPFRPHQRIELVQAVEIGEYAGILNEFDIGLAPVLDITFNRSKSDLKFVEYGMMGLPVIASKIAPYERSIKPGENGFLARNPKDWIRWLSRLIDDYDTRDRLGAAARLFAEGRTIEGNIHIWEKAYRIS